MKQNSFKIEGMTCSACANRVERAVKKLDGVEESNVNFATETLSVKFDETKVDVAKIEETVVKAVYFVRKDMRDYTFKVEGMTCSACSNRVERGVKKMEGINNANVNLTTEILTVDFDENKISSDKIEKKVEALGYSIVKKIKTHTYKVEGMTCAV